MEREVHPHQHKHRHQAAEQLASAHLDQEQGGRAAGPNQQVESGDAADSSNQNKAPNQRAKLSPSIRSQSSPSSLTTHKFGLRLTPSPPRLMIDHETGDIIEAYPEQPVYLRTFQPVAGELPSDDSSTIITNNPSNQPAAVGGIIDYQEEEDDDTAPNTNTFDDSLHSHPFPAQQHADQNHSESDGQQLAQRVSAPRQTSSAPIARANHQHPPPAMNHQPQRALIAPPHVGAHKSVYFGPLDYQPHGACEQHKPRDPGQSQRVTAAPKSLQVSVGERQFTLDDLAPSQHEQPLRTLPALVGASSELARSVVSDREESLKRALRQLEGANPSDKTDIVIVVEPDGSGGKEIKFTRTNATRASILLNAAKQYKAQQLKEQQQRQQQAATAAAAATGGIGQQQRPTGSRGAQISQTSQVSASESKKQQRRFPSLKEFDIYGWFYTFIILLVLLISSSIIYFFTVPLHFNCLLFRPSYSYVSLILASVNLICIATFSLFWYCRGVTRTFYENLSASAFIVTIYSVLVCLNISIAILFFFINTCHDQRIANTLTGPSLVASSYSEQHNSTKFLLTYDAERGIQIERILKLGSPAATRDGDNDEHQAKSRQDRRSAREEAELLQALDLADGGNSRAHARRNSDDSNDNDDGDENEATDDGTKSDDEPQEDATDANAGDTLVRLPAANRTAFEDSLTSRRQQFKPPVDGGGLQATQPPPNQSAGSGRRIIIDGYDPRDVPPESPRRFPQQPTSFGGQGQAQVFKMSPLEAGWEFTKRKTAEFARKSLRFLHKYDLRFIGALHAICAICFQFLAVKLAAIRSHYSLLVHR